MTLYLMLFNVIVLLPFYQFYICFAERDNGLVKMNTRFLYRAPRLSLTLTLLSRPVSPAWLRRNRWPLAAFCWAVYLYFFWKIGDQFPINAATATNAGDYGAFSFP